MFFGQNRQEIRHTFYDVWGKINRDHPLTPLEQVIASVVLDHPEYHRYLDNPDTYGDMDFSPDGGQTNPFLHMGLHIAIREQIGSDRPPGIGDLWRTLQAGGRDVHELEHELLECLAEFLWVAQRENGAPDETGYLDCIQRRTGLA